MITSDDKLVRALREWAEGRSASAEHVRALQDRVIESLAGSRPLVSQSGEHGALVRWGALAYGTLAVAATLLIGITLVQWLSSPTDGEPQPVAAQFSAIEVAAKARLLGELRALFGDRFGWVAESDQHVQIGLSDEESAAKGPYLAYRLVMFRKAASETQWQTVWIFDVVAGNELVVHEQQAGGQGNSVSLWGFLLPDGNVAVDVEAQLTAIGGVRSKGSVVTRPGVPTELFSGSKDNVEYRFYQTVMLVTADVS